MAELSPEVERRYRLVREAMAREDIEVLIVAGSEYTGFEGAVLYLSGFLIVHRYAYVLFPSEGDPSIVFPSEARYVGEHGAAWIEEQIFADHPGAWLADRVRGRRVGAYGLDYVMPVRDYRPLASAAEILPFDDQFDLARAVKSDTELDSVRNSVRINADGFWTFLAAYEPGRTEAEILAPAERLFVERGCGRRTMNMVLSGENGSSRPEFTIADSARRVAATDLLLPSLEVAGSGGHWVELSRPICAAGASDETLRMVEPYLEYFDAARRTLANGATAHDVHRAVLAGFAGHGFRLGHVTGHSIGMTMIEFPRIGEGEDTVLREGMVVSMHPHVLTPDGRSCFFMQDTWLVGSREGIRLSEEVPVRIFDGSERP